MNNTTTFETARIGDRVWSVDCGWGEVQDTSHSDTYPLLVKFTDGTCIPYTLMGSWRTWRGNQTLFWDVVKIEPPTKPLPKLEVDTKVFVWDVPDARIKGHFSHFNDNGDICIFRNGSTSFTSRGGTLSWKYWELAE